MYQQKCFKLEFVRHLKNPFNFHLIPKVINLTKLHLKMYINAKFIFLKKLAKAKFAKIAGLKEFQDLTASTWVDNICRDIRLVRTNSDYYRVHKIKYLFYHIKMS